MDVRFCRQSVGHFEVFYRQAGPEHAPVILLLHGFPTSSHMFRDLIPELCGRYRVIAPDLPGFGQTKAPPRGVFDYTFDNLARVMQHFVDQLELDRFALYVFDYGAPVGYRMASTRPERISAIISQAPHPQPPSLQPFHITTPMIVPCSDNWAGSKVPT